MNKKIIVIALALAMLALPMSAALAKNNEKFIPVKGTMQITAQGTLEFKYNPIGPPSPSGNNILVVTGNTMTWYGDIAGDADASGHFLIHNMWSPDSYATATNTHIFTAATVDGKTGGLTIISSGLPTNGQWRIIKGTDDLAGIHGQGIWEIVNPATQVYSYEGTVFFDSSPS